jgi:hypothetical protein
MKKLLLIFSLLAVVTSQADTPLKNVTITGTDSQIASGSFAVKSGATVTYESGSTLDATAATLKVGTITGAANTDVTIDANGTGKIVIKDTVTTGANQDLVEDANGTGKFVASDTVTTPTNADLVIAPNGTGNLDLRAAALKAGTATAGTAPLKFTAGTNLTAAEAGAIEYDGSWIYYSSSTPTRFRLSRETNATTISSTAIDWSAASTFTKTLSANTTFTFSSATDGQTIVVALTNTASNYTVTWPTVSWAGAASPVQTVGAHTDVYTFIKIGSTYYGSAVQNF